MAGFPPVNWLECAGELTQRLIFNLLKIEYHWKGKIVNLEKPIEPEEDDEQEDEET